MERDSGNASGEREEENYLIISSRFERAAVCRDYGLVGSFGLAWTPVSASKDLTTEAAMNLCRSPIWLCLSALPDSTGIYYFQRKLD